MAYLPQKTLRWSNSADATADASIAAVTIVAANPSATHRPVRGCRGGEDEAPWGKARFVMRAKGERTAASRTGQNTRRRQPTAFLLFG